ncbi:helix-turn-helix domain-containing protein [Nakamurella sp. A5-74]|uniref:Helix-turn-helix domain-containing protein n=1 Tax=Nakamurella sp. A5-74 TaxID=3158264 RepID=A0AAU8DR36_9ACTN
MEDDSELLTTGEAARLMRVPGSTLVYWRGRGEGPQSFRIGRRVVYRRHEIDRWIRAQETAGVA